MRVWRVPMTPRSPEHIVARRPLYFARLLKRAKDLPPAPTFLCMSLDESPAPGVSRLRVRSCRDHDREPPPDFAGLSAAFAERGLSAAWQRVIALWCSQEWSSGTTSYLNTIAARRVHCRGIATESRARIRSTFHGLPALSALAGMVEDHFAILKVGPWLTFAFREAVFS